MPTTLSSTFDVVFDGPTLTANQVCTMSVGDIGRGGFVIEEVSATGSNGTTATFTRVPAGGGPFAAAVVTAALVVPGTVDDTEQVIPAGASLVCTVSGGGGHTVTRFVIRCRPLGTTLAQVIA